MEADATQEGQEAPLLGFIFGNVDANNKLEADYLDEDAKEHLNGLARLDDGALRLQDELQAQQPAAGEALAEPAVQPAPDAHDYADEAELIEDAEQQAAAAAARQHQLGMVSAALRTGVQAEEEDYDDEDEVPATAPHHAPAGPAAPAWPEAATRPSVLTGAPPQPKPAVSKVLVPATAGAAALVAFRQHVRLPVLGRSTDGETVLRFSELYGPQGVMAGHVSSADDLLPPPMLRRARQRHTQQPARARAGEEGSDEQVLLLAADLEVPAEEVDEVDHVEPPKQPGHPLPDAQGDGQPGLQEGQLNARARQQDNLQQQRQQQPAGLDAAVPIGSSIPGSRMQNARAELPRSTFYPVNTVAWEDNICWLGCAAPPASGPDFAGQQQGAQSEHSQGEAGSLTLQQEQQHVDGWPATAELPATPPADIAAMFQQQDPQQVAAMQVSSAADVAVNGVHGQLAVASSSSELAAGELPGLESMTAAETLARTAAESDEEETLALPVGPLLRLEQLLAMAGAEGVDRRELLAGLPKPHMYDDHWEERIAWRGKEDADKLRAEAPALDLNDDKQVFELTRPLGQGHGAAGGRQRHVAAVPSDVAQVVERAAALVIEPQTQVLPMPPRASGFNTAQPEEVELWRLQQGLSREREYQQQHRRKTGTAGTIRVLHAKLASDLATLPILNPTNPTQEEVLALAFWHTPRGKWWPLEVSTVSWAVDSKKAKAKKQGGRLSEVSLTFTTLAGLSKTYQVELTSRLQDLWQHLVDNIAMFGPAAGQHPMMLLPGRPPKLLPPDQPLTATGVVKAGSKQLKLFVAFQDIELLSSASVNSVPENDNPALLRPPNAFTRKRDFSAAEAGHVVLLEYMEQQPPLLNRPGMGAKLVTYYRKRDPADVDFQKLKQGKPGWQVGTVQALGEDDDSPFLGQLHGGASSLSVESGLFRSLAHPYSVPHTDFLLVRMPVGTMHLRELSGTVVLGQELPMHRVPAPTAREVKDLEERRIYVHVFKHLRRQQAKLDGDPATQGQKAFITLKAVSDVFPSRPPAMIRSYLKDSCDLVVHAVKEEEHFYLKDNARPPSEAELRKKLTPEEVCTLEACYVAAFRMKHRGLLLHDKLDKAAIEKLRLAAEMLPPDERYQKAARLVEQAMQSAPWTLTDAFVTHFREGKAQLQLAGAADPTGRGFGYSFVRDVRHKHANADDVTKQMAKRQAGKVQGTDADLRRMTTAQAKERLKGYGLSDEDIAGLTRWGMIDMVRSLASASAHDGTVDAATVKFVRHQKTTMIELQRRAAERAQQIFDKQIAVLNDTAAEDLGDQDALEAELERELAAADEEAEAAAAGGEAQRKKKGGEPTPEDEQRMMQQMRAEGLMAAPAGDGGAAGGGAAAGAAPLPEGAGGPAPKEGPGTKRIRREVFLKAANGSWQKSHEIVYLGRDRPGQLHSLYQKEGASSYPFGFGSRTIAGRPKELRLSYAAARGRGVGRGGGRSGSGRGRGRGRGSKLGLVSPEAGRARQSNRQRKQRQFDDDMWDGDELISDTDDEEYNEEAEAPYFAAEQQPKQAKRARTKKQPAADAADGGPQQPQQPQEPFPALPDDFAAALAAATMVRPPAPPSEPADQAAAAPPAAAPPAEAAAAAPAGGEAFSEGVLPEVGMDVLPDLQPAFVSGEPPGAQLQPPQQPQQQQQPPVNVKGIKIKINTAPITQPAREPSPDFVYDYTVGEEDDAQQRRSGKAQDADYEAHMEQDDASDDFVPEEDEEISEGDSEERRFMKKARSRSGRFGAPLARAGSRRSGGSAGGARRGGVGVSRRPAGTGARGKPARQGGGGGGGRSKRGRSEFEDFDDEEEEDVELSEEEEEEEAFSDDGATSEEDGGAPARSRANRPAAAAAAGREGQLGAVGRQLGTILASIVQQLRNQKMQWGGPALTKVYDLVFGKVPSSKAVPDYHSYVPKARVIILPEVQKKAKAGRYLSLEQFRGDLQQLYNNAVTYNSPGTGGAYGHPDFIQLAARLLEDAEALIAQNMDAIQSAETFQPGPF